MLQADAACYKKTSGGYTQPLSATELHVTYSYDGQSTILSMHMLTPSESSAASIAALSLA